MYSEQVALDTNLQAVAVKIHFDVPITICCVYLHQSDVITTHSLHQLIEQLSGKYIFTDNFNAHNIIWGSTYTDHRGETIESFLESINNAILNSGIPTIKAHHWRLTSPLVAQIYFQESAGLLVQCYIPVTTSLRL